MTVRKVERKYLKARLDNQFTNIGCRIFSYLKNLSCNKFHKTF